MPIRRDFFKSLVVVCSLFLFAVICIGYLENHYVKEPNDRKLIVKEDNELYEKAKYYDTDYLELLQIFNNRNKKIPYGWEQIDLNKNGKGEFYINNRSGFEATAFIKGNNIVMLIRGMHIDNAKSAYVFNGGDGKSAKSIFLSNIGIPFLGRIPDQFYDALKFYKIVRENYPDYKIILVGKSMGGSLAQLLGAIYGHETFTFAAPGMKYAIRLLNSDLKQKVYANSFTGYCYIRNYHNLNDPCCCYGDQIGLSYVYPPIQILKSPIYEVHGDLKHFGDKNVFKSLKILPKDWKSKYTAALIYYDSSFKENVRPISLHKFIKLKYRINDEDLFEAITLAGNLFKKDETKNPAQKTVVSSYRCRAE